MSPSDEQVVPLRTPVPVGSVQGTLALDLVPRQNPPHVPGRLAAEVIPIDQPARREVERWARRYAQAAVEIVGGDRPVSQLLRWSTREVYEDLTRRAQLVARAGGHSPGEGRVQPVRPVVLGVARAVSWCAPGAGPPPPARAPPPPPPRPPAPPPPPPPHDRWQCSALDFA